MFTKYKQAIEKWLRGLIAADVAKLETSLQSERAALWSTIRVFDAQVNAAASTFKECSVQLNAAVERLNELSHFKENAELRAHIKELNSHITGIADTVKELHPELVKK
ncbi:MAG: hypothetical protein WBQ68_11930 [Terriglobales bacterium]